MERRGQKLIFPRTLGTLKAWLRDTEVGKSLLDELTVDFQEDRCWQCQAAYQASPKVLVVIRRLGPLPGVVVFAERGARVRLEELVDSENDKVLEVRVEDLLIAQLPKLWKHLPNCRSDSGVFRGLTAARRIESIETMRMLKELRQASELNSIS